MSSANGTSSSWQTRGNFLNGTFCEPGEVEDSILSRSPADLNDCLGEFPTSVASVELAVEQARDAFRSWKRSSQAEREGYLRKYQEAIRKRTDEMTEVLAREVGKPLWEAWTEINAMAGKIDITLREGMADISELRIENILPGTEGLCRHRPLGVLAVIGPFNFPAHLPNGHIVPALAAGNTVIFKPSEKAPLTGQLIAECIADAEFPEGVFSLVQGARAVAKRLVEHEGVDGILFTGSYDVGLAIKRATLEQPGKLLALEMGGKNGAIVCADANIDLALYETIGGAFMTTGQRCSATSRIFVEKSIFEEFCDRFEAIAAKLDIGHPMENPFMGPVIDKESFRRVQSHGEQLISEGFDVSLMPSPVETSKKGYYLRPCVARAKKVISGAALRKYKTQEEELFGPAVTIFPYENLEQAIDSVNETDFGLVASVFTKNRLIFENCWHEINTGLLNWNKSTVGASSKLPFGGLGKSGNHFPTALYASRYVTAPIASMCTLGRDNPKITIPGMHWDK